MFNSLQIRRSQILLYYVGLCSIVTNASSCRQEKTVSAARPLHVIVSCDTAGWIVPCGCSSKQAGGLLRRATYVKQVSTNADVLLADAGGAPGGTSLYDRCKFEAVLAGERAMQVAAHNIGAAEAELGADYLRKLPETLAHSFISSNIRDGHGEYLVATHQIATVGNKRVAICGVLSPSFQPVGLKVEEPAEALMRLIPTLKGKHDVLLLLAYLPEQELETLVSQIPEADLIIGGPTRQSITPKRSGPTVWGAATNKGKFLVHLEKTERSNWNGKIVELGPDISDEPTQVANLASFRDELAKRDFSADQTSFSSPLPADAPSDFRVAGTESCRDCHVNDCKEWSASRHAHAWQTLLDKKSQVDPYCQQCHTTGYGLPGGFVSLATSNHRTNVGCESCHGPSQAHVRSTSAKTMFDARDRCTKCHDHENSPEFDFSRFWDQITHGTRAVSSGEK